MVIWWLTLVQKVAAFAFREQLQSAERFRREAELHIAAVSKSRDEWKTRYLSVNDKFSERAALMTETRVRLELTLKENERLRSELLDSVLLTKDLIGKIGVPGPAKDQREIKRLMAQEDPFAEDTTQADVYVDRPGASPSEIGEDIAAAFTKQG